MERCCIWSQSFFRFRNFEDLNLLANFPMEHWYDVPLLAYLMSCGHLTHEAWSRKTILINCTTHHYCLSSNQATLTSLLKDSAAIHMPSGQKHRKKLRDIPHIHILQTPVIFFLLKTTCLPYLMGTTTAAQCGADGCLNRKLHLCLNTLFLYSQHTHNQYSKLLSSFPHNLPLSCQLR